MDPGFPDDAGGPYGSTQVLLTYAYQQAFTYFQFSYGAAIASLIAVLIFSIFTCRCSASAPRKDRLLGAAGSRSGGRSRRREAR